MRLGQSEVTMSNAVEQHSQRNAAAIDHAKSMRRRIARLLIKAAYRLDPPERLGWESSGQINRDITAAIVRAEEQLAKAHRDARRRHIPAGHGGMG